MEGEFRVLGRQRTRKERPEAGIGRLASSVRTPAKAGRRDAARVALEVHALSEEPVNARTGSQAP